MIPRVRPRAENGDERLPGRVPPRDPPDLARRGLLYCCQVFVGTRLLLAVVGLVAVALLPDLSGIGDLAQRGLVPHPVSVPGWPAHVITPGWHNVFTAWEREDALWFLRIATGGYRTADASAAFFPLYPLAIRALSFLIGGHPLAASLLVSNGAFLGALIVLYLLTSSELSEEMARRAVLYCAVFPTAFFFLAPYSESLFLLLVLAVFWAMRRGRFGWAGLAGALAALTRNLGVFLALPIAVEALHQAAERRGAGPGRPGLRSGGGPWREALRSGAWSAGPVVGLLAYLAYWGNRSGHWLAPLTQQANWDRHLTNPLATLGKGTTAAFRYLGAYPGGYHLLDWLIALPVIAALVYSLVRLRPCYGLFFLAGVLVPLSSIFEGRPLIAFSRYALPLFPLYWAAARWSQGRPEGRASGGPTSGSPPLSAVRHEMIIVASAALLGIMALLFVNWYYVI